MTYPCWAELRTATTWWRSPRIVPLTVGVLASAVVFTIAVIAIGRQIGGTDLAAQANWWADYAEHVSLLGIAALVASSGRPGWRILALLTGVAWLYLGFVAVFLLPTHTASWGTVRRARRTHGRDHTDGRRCRGTPGPRRGLELVRAFGPCLTAPRRHGRCSCPSAAAGGRHTPDHRVPAPALLGHRWAGARSGADRSEAAAERGPPVRSAQQRRRVRSAPPSR